MNAERLHAIANAIRSDLQTTKAINLLQELSKALENQINSPQEPTHQTQVAETLGKLMQALETAPTAKSISAAVSKPAVTFNKTPTGDTRLK